VLAKGSGSRWPIKMPVELKAFHNLLRSKQYLTARNISPHMTTKTAFLVFATLLLSCGSEPTNKEAKPVSKPIEGTWKLLTGTLIEKGDTVITDYTKNVSFIKIINDTHFAFLQHDEKKEKDSVATFSAGGGSYSLRDSLYTEHLQYCSAREWEGHDFTFTISLYNDTLIQQGIEKVEGAGIDRINIEKYVRLKK
jgi:hypothetical protein